MIVRRLARLGTVLLIVGGCADTRTILEPTPPALSATAAARQVEASGHFDAVVDFSTLTLTPRGRNCLLQVSGQLLFTGTIVGTGTGQTTALVFASCAEVAVTPPGTYRDVFHFDGVFQGTIDGQPAEANLAYMGGVQPGGHIDGRLLFANGVAGRLEADAQVAVGGDYHGSVVVR